jgi:hypothetical protein
MLSDLLGKVWGKRVRQLNKTGHLRELGVVKAQNAECRADLEVVPTVTSPNVSRHEETFFDPGHYFEFVPNGINPERKKDTKEKIPKCRKKVGYVTLRTYTLEKYVGKVS